MTPEQQAVEIYLAKPKHSYSACACLGPQPISDDDWNKTETYQVKLLDIQNNLETLRLIRIKTGLGVQESKNVMILGTVSFNTEENAKAFVREANIINTKTEQVSNKIKRFPRCPCSMRNVVEVDNQFYEINENMTSSGIEHTATLLGTVGGPYK